MCVVFRIVVTRCQLCAVSGSSMGDTCGMRWSVNNFGMLACYWWII